MSSLNRQRSDGEGRRDLEREKHAKRRSGLRLPEPQRFLWCRSSLGCWFYAGASAVIAVNETKPNLFIAWRTADRPSSHRHYRYPDTTCRIRLRFPSPQPTTEETSTTPRPTITTTCEGQNGREQRDRGGRAGFTSKQPKPHTSRPSSGTHDRALNTTTHTAQHNTQHHHHTCNNNTHIIATCHGSANMTLRR